LYLPKLPLSRALEFEGVPIALAHGHGGWKTYVADRLYITAYGLQPERFKRRMWQSFPEAKVIVFGHLHLPILEWIDGRLLINPGSACCPDENAPGPSVALVHLGAGGKVDGEIVYLEPAWG
jgi:predicted phosphodiesterase